MRKLTLVTVAAITLACGGKTLDVGSNGNQVNPGAPGFGGSGGTNTSPPTPLNMFPEPDACATSDPSPIVGTWLGTNQSPYSIYDQTLRVVIFGASEDRGVCGTITFGTGNPPPAATDPDVAYPSAETGYWPPDDTTEGYAGGPSSWGPYHGFAYTMLDGSMSSVLGSTTAKRVRFNASFAELWNGWCGLQTPIPDGCISTHSRYAAILISALYPSTRISNRLSNLPDLRAARRVSTA